MKAKSLATLFLFVLTTNLVMFLIPAARAQGKPGSRPLVLDVVVRDQEGSLVRDLKAEEFEVIDNGVSQVLQKSEFGPQSGEPQLVTLVFGGLGNEGRQYARRAAGDLLKQAPKGQLLISVFVIDRRLYALTPFTQDIDDVEAGVELATSGSFENYIKASEEIQKDLAREKNGSPRDRAVAAVLERAGKVQWEEWTYAALDSLNILVEELGKLPGRKPVLFFSEGMIIRDVMFDRLDFIISTANLANAPIYTVDSRGLLTLGVTEGSREMLSGASAASQSQFGSGATSSGQVRSLESASQSVRMNVQEALGNLSNRTGGFLIANTNDPLPGMKQILEEINGYYRLVYRPERNGDGSFRPVDVRMTRLNVRVRSAAGYFDLPEAGSEPLLSFELPLLSILGDPEVFNPFDLHARLFRFGRKEDGIQHTLALRVPLQHFTFVPQEETKSYATHFSLLGLLRDPSGEVVERFSQDYPLQGPLDKLEGLKTGNVLFLRNFSIPSGKYSLEVAAVDHGTGKTSAARDAVVIEAWADGPAVSDVVVIDRVDPISDPTREQDNPLRYEDRKLAPNMGSPVIKDPSAQLGLYFVVYLSSSIKATPTLGVIFFRNGEPLFKGEPPLPQPDPQGRSQVILNLPLSSFQTGDYQVIVLVQQGDAAAERTASFSITDR